MNSPEVEMEDAAAPTRYERGLKKMSEVYGIDVGEFVTELGEVGRYMAEFPYADIYSRPGLAWRDREIATFAMLTAMGGREPQLRTHIAAALNAGLIVAELEEIIIQTIIFAGFPTAINALNFLHETLAELNPGRPPTTGPRSGDLARPAGCRQSRFERR
jgi:4-carboxymuconolactone decarboxylase